MNSNATPPADIERIVRAVKLEAARLELEQVATHPAPPTPSPELEAVDWPSPRLDLDVDYFNKGTPHLRDFLLLDPEVFVKKAYAELLGRPADLDGLSHYLNRLNNGELRQRVLMAFVNSAEGKARQAKVAGLGLLWRLIEQFKRIDKSGRLTRFVGRVLNRLEHHWYFSQADLRFVRIQIYLARLNRAGQGTARNTTKLLERLDARLRELDAESRGLRAALANAVQQVRQLEYQLDQAQAGSSSSASVPAAPAEHSAPPPYLSQVEVDRFYFAFEEACRGSQADILNKLRHYLPHLPLTGSKQVVDVGCGRGEWLVLLQEAGYQATGLDINQVMVEICQEKGLNAQQRDVIEYLSAQPGGSLAAVTGFHVAEHIGLDLLLRLIKEAHRTLQKGGVLILETPNPENVLVGSHTFYHDPTHKNPLTPTLMQFMAQYFGFETIEILRLSPYPEEAKVPGLDPLTERVNGHLCGPQDFALLARK